MDTYSFSAHEIVELIESAIVYALVFDLIIVCIALYLWFKFEKNVQLRIIAVASVLIAPIIGSITIIILSLKRKRSLE